LCYNGNLVSLVDVEIGNHFITYSLADEFCIVGYAVCDLSRTKTIEKCDVLTEDSLKVKSTFRNWRYNLHVPSDTPTDPFTSNGPQVDPQERGCQDRKAKVYKLQSQMGYLPGKIAGRIDAGDCRGTRVGNAAKRVCQVAEDNDHQRQSGAYA